MKTAIVIGAGFGGLALGIRLQSAGIQTTIVEARDKAGGRGYHWNRQGFTFDAGPTVITDPPCLEELWALSGNKIADDVDLMPVKPFYRLNWPDGTNYDYANDEEAGIFARCGAGRLSEARLGRVPLDPLYAEGCACFGALSGLAVSLFDRVQICEE
jgi:phytoene dehydrogenase-like protein